MYCKPQRLFERSYIAFFILFEEVFSSCSAPWTLRLQEVFISDCQSLTVARPFLECVVSDAVLPANLQLCLEEEICLYAFPAAPMLAVFSLMAMAMLTKVPTSPELQVPLSRISLTNSGVN
jgi:hypothetical protein